MPCAVLYRTILESLKTENNSFLCQAFTNNALWIYYFSAEISKETVGVVCAPVSTGDCNVLDSELEYTFWSGDPSLTA